MWIARSWSLRNVIRANIEGAFQLLEAAKEHWLALPADEQCTFRFLHVSTDEVCGSLTPAAPAFTDVTPYAPNTRTPHRRPRRITWCVLPPHLWTTRAHYQLFQ